ncbi:hypothetical protein A0H81_10396 [Grifola frondosa]|uniref:Uncharacterized protein n=1 Tax=Grifola frondosa TaxID=5627 RepID=A0A1C7LZN1_GRIFR|nr:hypothetical protein A0H81_10396 [Grifola frondosa]
MLHLLNLRCLLSSSLLCTQRHGLYVHFKNRNGGRGQESAIHLLHTQHMTLEHFAKPPPYAILSHRWRDGEVLFQDIHDISHAKTLKGHSKVSQACAMASKDGYDWIWMDTCCIDQKSSAEQSEAINSMYAWYRDAEICYAYLDDVRSDEDCEGPLSSFRHSEWFTRGWTLQELIAPRRLVFVAGDWKNIGTRTGLVDTIEEITRIHRLVLLRVPMKCSIAARMSWAAKRQTSRVEDRAYSLMGLFGVHMPTIYGEGEQAFVRLQQEIMKHSNDHSIFAWQPTKVFSIIPMHGVVHFLTSEPDLFQTGILASSPDNFFYCADIVQMPYEEFEHRFSITASTPEYSATNYGIRIQLPLNATFGLEKIPDSQGYTAALPGVECCLAALACTVSNDQSSTVCILLAKIPQTSSQFVRMTPYLVLVDHHNVQHFTPKDVYIRQEPVLRVDISLHDASRKPYLTCQFEVKDGHLQERGMRLFFRNGSPTHSQRLHGWRRYRGLRLKTVLREGDHSAFGAVVFRCSKTGLVFAAVVGIERVPGTPADAPCPWVDVLVGDENNAWLSKRNFQEIERKIQEMYGGNSEWHNLNRTHPRRRLSGRVTRPFGQGYVRVSIRDQGDLKPYNIVDILTD